MSVCAFAACWMQMTENELYIDKVQNCRAKKTKWAELHIHFAPGYQGSLFENLQKEASFFLCFPRELEYAV